MIRIQELLWLSRNRPGFPQIRPYESGQSQPTLDAIRKLAVALSVSADMLIFEDQERGPDDDLKLQFETVSKFDAEENRSSAACSKA